MNDARIQEIETNLRSNALNIRISALDKLATLSPTVALPILDRLFASNDFALRRIAVMGFGNHLTDESYDRLTEILTTEKDANVLAEAANSLFFFGDRAIAPLQELFARSDNWLVQQTVISILVDCDNPNILLDIAQKAIAIEDQTTKEMGILALSRLLNTPLKPQAFAIFTELATDSYWRTRWRVAIALTATKDPLARALLAELQQDENYRVVAAALENCS